MPEGGAIASSNQLGLAGSPPVAAKRRLLPAAALGVHPHVHR
jgi:hypothetical protein